VTVSTKQCSNRRASGYSPRDPVPVRGGRHAQDAILAALADGAALRGTTTALAATLGVSVTAFRAGLRRLLETEGVAATADRDGRLTIRLEPRWSRYFPSRIGRRGAHADVTQ
jgi:hypothetical protein